MTDTLSIVMPALNERHNLAAVLSTIPVSALTKQGWRLEVIVVDNGSTDGTGALARGLGLRVVEQPRRGYGNAYRAGIEAAAGGVIATGDVDRTYPFEALPALLDTLFRGNHDFLTTNRMLWSNREAMGVSHLMANHALSAACRALLHSPFRDSQSGMWVFRRDVWVAVDVRSEGMAFSQELKHEAFLKGFNCIEVPIMYHQRGGEVKLQAGLDGLKNLRQLAGHRLRYGMHAPQPGALPRTSA